MNRDQYWTQKNFCPAPWTELYVAPNGRVDNCCISTNNIGDISTQDAENIINNESSRSIRQMMIQNRDVSGCAACFKNPAQWTLRNDYLDWFQHYDISHFSSEKNFRLGLLDLRWRNTCNSACVYCGPNDSSLWASELGIKDSSDEMRIKNMRQLVESRAHEIEYLYLAGGEPLLIKENKWVLDTIYEVNPNCEIRINTNLNSIDNPVFDALIKFSRIRWIISGESIGEKYEYVRYGSTWDKFIANLKQLKSNFPNHWYTFHMVYCALTAHTFPEYIDFLKTEKIFHANDAFTTYYVSSGTGMPLDPRNLPKSIADNNLHMLNLSIEQNQKTYFAESLIQLRTILESPYPQKNTLTLYEFLQTLDGRRNLDSRKIFPELYKDF